MIRQIAPYLSKASKFVLLFLVFFTFIPEDRYMPSWGFKRVLLVISIFFSEISIVTRRPLLSVPASICLTEGLFIATTVPAAYISAP